MPDLAVECLDRSAAEDPSPEAATALNRAGIWLDIWLLMHPAFASAHIGNAVAELSRERRSGLLACFRRQCQLAIAGADADASMRTRIQTYLTLLRAAEQAPWPAGSRERISLSHANTDLSHLSALDAARFRAVALAQGFEAPMALAGEPRLDGSVAQGVYAWYLPFLRARHRGDLSAALTLYERHVCEAVAAVSVLGDAVRQAVRGALETRAERASDIRLQPTSVVRKATLLIRQRPDLKVAEIARLLFMSERCLRDAFKRCLGISPKAYQVETRLVEVKRAVDAGSCEGRSIEEIAEQHGFSHPGRLSAAYRRRFGVTITQRPAADLVVWPASDRTHRAEGLYRPC